MSENTNLVTYALFAGGGGLHLGLEKAGFEIALATDVSEYAASTHKLNRPSIPFVCGDLRKIPSSALLSAAGGRKPDLVVGGPPCQGFSTLGDKISADPRNNLFDAFARVVNDLQPTYMLMENVKSLTTMYGGRFKDHIIETFEAMGYKVYWRVLDAADFGVPQFRQRVFFFGTRRDAAFSFPAVTHGPQADLPYRTTWEAISDLVGRGPECPNHIALSHSEKVIRRYRLVPPGGRLPKAEELPEDIRRGNFGNTYKRLHPNKPSLTMVPGNNAFPIHPTLDRSLTPREAARLQTFSDDIFFDGDRRTQCILVGNAVPVDLAAAVGRSIATHHSSNAYVRPVKVAELKKMSIKTTSYAGSFVDLFCGAGGITIGMSRAGWKPILGVDLNKNASATHRQYFEGVRHIEGDVSSPDIKDEILESVSGQEISIVVGGPPCQGFSMFGNRRFVNTKGYDPHLDPRNKLVFSFVDMVRAIDPRWFVMENVPGLANLDSGLFLETLLADFKELGYSSVEYRILNAADYGVPQLRKRLLIIGNRTGHIIPWPKKKFFAAPRDWQDGYRTVGEVISDLAEQSSYDRYTCHVPMRHKPLLVERYKYIPEGGKLDPEKLPVELQVGYRTDKVKNYSHVFKRLHRDRPSTTMVPGHNAFPIHPWLNRALTVREAARIQTFPDDMEFLGSRQEQCIQVGNAFPPLLAEVLGNNIRKAEVNGWVPGNVPASAYYSLVDRYASDEALAMEDGEDPNALNDAGVDISES
ncbi:MAG: DNA cytosine methyltransferase [Rhodobacteraceae bacterium]|nr:DNA cytosine methyltransferase [Paracoccaceae bacterium]